MGTTFASNSSLQGNDTMPGNGTVTLTSGKQVWSYISVAVGLVMILLALLLYICVACKDFCKCGKPWPHTTISKLCNDVKSPNYWLLLLLTVLIASYFGLLYVMEICEKDHVLSIAEKFVHGFDFGSLVCLIGLGICPAVAVDDPKENCNNWKYFSGLFHTIFALLFFVICIATNLYWAFNFFPLDDPIRLVMIGFTSVTLLLLFALVVVYVLIEKCGMIKLKRLNCAIEFAMVFSALGCSFFETWYENCLLPGGKTCYEEYSMLYVILVITFFGALPSIPLVCLLPSICICCRPSTTSTDSEVTVPLKSQVII